MILKLLRTIVLAGLPGFALGRLFALGAGSAPPLDLLCLTAVLAAGWLSGYVLSRKFGVFPLALAALVCLLLPEYDAWLFRTAAGLCLGGLLALPGERFPKLERCILVGGVFTALALGLAGGRPLLLSTYFRWLVTLAALPGLLFLFFHHLPAASLIRRQSLTAMLGIGALSFLFFGPVSLYRQPGRPALDSNGRCFLSQMDRRLEVTGPDGTVRWNFPQDNFRHQALVLPALLQTDSRERILFLAEAPSVIPAMLAGFEQVSHIDCLIATPRFDRMLDLPASSKIHDLPWQPYRLRPANDEQYQLILISELPAASPAARRLLVDSLADRLAPDGILIMPDESEAYPRLPYSEELPVPGFRVWSAVAQPLPGNNFDLLEKRLEELALPGGRQLPHGLLRELYTWQASLAPAPEPRAEQPQLQKSWLTGFGDRLPEFPFWGMAAILLTGYAVLRAWSSRYAKGYDNGAAVENGLAAGLFLCAGMTVLSDFALLNGNVAGLLIGAAASLLLLTVPTRFQGLNSFLLFLSAALLLLSFHWRSNANIIGLPLLLFLLLFTAARSGRGGKSPIAGLAAIIGLAAAPPLFLLLGSYTDQTATAALIGGVLLLLPRRLKI